MWDAALDLVVGTSCLLCSAPGRVLCRSCDLALPQVGVPMAPQPVPPGLVPSYAVGPYDDPLRPLLLAHKEHQVFALARPLGRMLAAAIRSAVEPETATIVLVPIPSRPAVVRRRGHDAIARMVRAAAGELRRAGCSAVAAPLLAHQGRVADQAGLDAEERAANLAGSLLVRAMSMGRLRRRLGDRQVVVVVCDDVITTGATAREAQRALTRSGLAPVAVTTVAATLRRHPGVARSALLPGDGPRFGGSLPLCSADG